MAFALTWKIATRSWACGPQISRFLCLQACKSAPKTSPSSKSDAWALSVLVCAADGPPASYGACQEKTLLELLNTERNEMQNARGGMERGAEVQGQGEERVGEYKEMRGKGGEMLKVDEKHSVVFPFGLFARWCKEEKCRSAGEFYLHRV